MALKMNRLRGIGLLVAAVLISVWRMPADAAVSATIQLKQFGNIGSVEAEFVQQQTLSDGRVEKTSGILLLQKPGKFRWEYRAPYRQLMISNGKRVWFYDVDLNQVIVRSLSQAIGDKPALLLSDPTQAEKHFHIRDLVISDEKLNWLEATPKQTGDSFSKIRIGFDNGIPKVVLLNDVFGNQTRLQLENVKINVPLNASEFEFSPPSGADVMTD